MKIYFLIVFVFLSCNLFSQTILPTFQATHNNSAVVVPPEDPNDLICSNISPYSSPLCSYSTGCSSPSAALLMDQRPLIIQLLFKPLQLVVELHL